MIEHLINYPLYLLLLTVIISIISAQILRNYLLPKNDALPDIQEEIKRELALKGTLKAEALKIDPYSKISEKKLDEIKISISNIDFSFKEILKRVHF